MPLISIVTPVFNAARWLTETLASVAAQTCTDWEHLLVDDGSSDESVALIESAARGDPRIRLFRMATNGGPARARNEALRQARGRYVAFLDADDLWLPRKLERALDFLRRNDCDFCYHGFRYLSADGSSAGRLVCGPRRLTLRTHHVGRGTGDCMSMVLDFRRILGFRFAEDRTTVHEDWLAWLWLLQQGYVGRLLPEDLGRYRLSPASRNANKLTSAVINWRIYRHVEGLAVPRAATWWLLYAWNSCWRQLRTRPRRASSAVPTLLRQAPSRLVSSQPAAGSLEILHPATHIRADELPVR